MPPKMTKTDDALRVNLSGHPNFNLAKDAIRAISGRRWNPDEKVWELPLDPNVAQRVLMTVRPEASPDLLSWIKEAKSEAQTELITPLPQDGNPRVPWRGRLYDFQRSFVEFSRTHPRCILADDMGLGKTAQALSAVVEYTIYERAMRAGGPKLIVCPNSVKGVWAREIKKWLGTDNSVIVEGTSVKKRHDALADAIERNAWVIVNWEQIRVHQVDKTIRHKQYDQDTNEFLGWIEEPAKVWELKETLFESTPWVAAIADEAHRAKNRDSQQTRGLWRIDAPMKLALTGTPLMNSPDELWAILAWLYPDSYHPQGKKHADTAWAYWPFYDQYVEYYEGAYGKIITGVKNPDALRFELAGKLVRRTKGEVLDLPEKVREIVPITLTPKQRKLYDEAERQMWIEIKQAIEEGDKDAKKFAEAAANGRIVNIINGAARTVRLRQIASTPATLGGEDDSAKLNAAVEIIMDAQPKQMVVFSEFVDTCNILAERLRKKKLRVGVYTGERTAAERVVMEDAFQNGDLDVIVGTIGAMKEGITLHAADTVMFLERSWVPAVNEQAEDRLHRVGQKNNVTVLILEAEDTVDTSKIAPTNEIKSMIVQSVIQKDHVATKETANV